MFKLIKLLLNKLLSNFKKPEPIKYYEVYIPELWEQEYKKELDEIRALNRNAILKRFNKK